MYPKNLLLAVLATTAVAEFAVITTPLPTNLAVLTDLSSYKSSILAHVSSGLSSLTADPAAISSASSAHAGLASFVATATYSIPPDVTKIGGIETFSTTPVWYSALPSDVKAYYDEFNKDVQRLVNQAILGNDGDVDASGTTAPGATRTSSSNTGAGAKETGAAGRSTVGVLGAGIAVAVAGVLAL